MGCSFMIVHEGYLVDFRALHAIVDDITMKSCAAWTFHEAFITINAWTRMVPWQISWTIKWTIRQNIRWQIRWQIRWNFELVLPTLASRLLAVPWGACCFCSWGQFVHLICNLVVHMIVHLIFHLIFHLIVHLMFHGARFFIHVLFIFHPAQMFIIISSKYNERHRNTRNTLDEKWMNNLDEQMYYVLL